jgi:RimJ/RimL family protein N-acetyltransferase
VNVRLRRLPPYSSSEEIVWADGGPGAGEEVALQLAAGGVPTWLVLGDDVAIGACGLHESLEESGTASVEIGYGIVASWRGRGCGRLAVATLLDELRALCVATVVAEVEVGGADPTSSVASMAILHALGFAELGMVAYPNGTAARFEIAL